MNPEKKRYILFGAGFYGRKAVSFLGAENIRWILDNNRDLDGQTLEGIPVRHYAAAKSDLHGETVVLCVSDPAAEEIRKQLEGDGTASIRFAELERTVILERADESRGHIETYRRAMDWVYRNTIPGEGICNRSTLRKPYPEVTGYFIPTLMRWGQRDLALQYAKWLCAVQTPEGAWLDTEGQAPYVFDTAQVLKGLLAVRTLVPEADAAVIRGCDWILSNMREDGRLTTPTTAAWGGNANMCDEIIHIYCISPLREAGRVYGRPDYLERAERILTYYKTRCRDQLLHFSLLSHFYAYLMEALLDLGETGLAAEAMRNLAEYQEPSGALPAYHNVHWVCSTGLFQLALVWYRLGERERAERAFRYGMNLQNPGGGWFGSYPSERRPEEKPAYLPDSEISWANKFFLDALYYRTVTDAGGIQDPYWDAIDPRDGRCLSIREAVEETGRRVEAPKIADIGCGKGRYLRALCAEFPAFRFYGVDPLIKDGAASDLPKSPVRMKNGLLTCIPYADETFDLTYACESLEHAVDIEAAVREMARVTKTGGTLVIVDKDASHLGALELGAWEQWFEPEALRDVLLKYCETVEVQTGISHDGMDTDRIFCAWKGTIKR